MIFNKNLKNILLVIFATLILSACSTAKKSGSVDGDVYTGKETVEYLAAGVPDRVFFATNKTSLTTASRATLRKQATFLRKNKNLNVTIEGHADERGTRGSFGPNVRVLNQEKRMSIRPLQDRVVVRRMEEETKSAGGIVIPGSAAEKPSQGEVLSVGPGKKLDNGSVQNVDLSVGDKVLFGQYSGSTVKVDGEELLIMSESEIFGVIE
jgi:chaperonin GroES